MSIGEGVPYATSGYFVYKSEIDEEQGVDTLQFAMQRRTISLPLVVRLLLSHSACRLPNLNVSQYFIGVRLSLGSLYIHQMNLLLINIRIQFGQRRLYNPTFHE